MSILKGDTTANLDLTATITSITSGATYKFSYYGRNAHGDGAESDTVSIIAATTPATMTAPSVTYTSSAYQVSFSVPVTTGGTGITITSYKILFKQSDGTYTESADCNGSSATVITNLYCTINLSTLTSSPYSLI